MKLTQNNIESYQRDGYLSVSGVFSHEEMDRTRKFVYRLYRKFRPDDASLDELESPWNDPAFDRKMIKLRAQDPKIFGALYDCAQSSVELVQLVTDKRVASIAAACLGESAETLGYSGVMFRMDPPRDNRNALEWHQDRAYYPQNEDGDHGLVITIALQDITAETGAVVICPRSQEIGFVAPVTSAKTVYEATEQRAVPSELIKKYDQVPAAMKKGDLSVMNMNVFHRSGPNLGSHIRYSILCRFHRILADDYVPFGLLYQFNKFLSDRIWKAQTSY